METRVSSQVCKAAMTLLLFVVSFLLVAYAVWVLDRLCW